MAQFVFVEARRLISFLAVRAHATCCMQLLSGQRSLPQSIFVPFAVGVTVAFTSLASSASFATFKSAAARPLLGGRVLYTNMRMYECVQVHMYSAYVLMYYTHECYNNFLSTFVYFSFAFRVCFILWRYQNFTLRIWRARHLF